MKITCNPRLFQTREDLIVGNSLTYAEKMKAMNIESNVDFDSEFLDTNGYSYLKRTKDKIK